MRRVSLDEKHPAAGPMAEAAAVIAAGGVVAVPTDTLYGLAADPFSPAAIARLFAVKGRDAGRAVALVAADVEEVVAHLGPLSLAAARLAGRFWPGPLTLLVPRPDTIPAQLTGGSDRVGVRVPAHEVTRALCRACGRPLTATSANLSGGPPTDDPDAVARALASADVDLLLDAGRTPGGPPSTVVDVTDDGLHLVRAGAIDWATLQACARDA